MNGMYLIQSLSYLCLLGVALSPNNWSTNQLAAAVSQNSHDLTASVEAGDVDSILKAGSSGDRSMIPIIRKQLKSKKHEGGGNGPYLSAAEAAHYSLAKLGETSDLKWLHCEVHSDKPNKIIYPRLNLKYVGGWFAINELVFLLDDSRFKKAIARDKKSVDVTLTPPSYYALEELSELLPEGPQTLRFDEERRSKDHQLHIQEWKAWIEEHKKSLQEREPSWTPSADERCP